MGCAASLGSNEDRAVGRSESVVVIGVLRLDSGPAYILDRPSGPPRAAAAAAARPKPSLVFPVEYPSGQATNSSDDYSDPP